MEEADSNKGGKYTIGPPYVTERNLVEMVEKAPGSL